MSDFTKALVRSRVRNKVLFVALLFCLLLSYATFFVLSEQTMISLTREDNVFETSTAIFYILAALIAFVIFISRRDGNDFSVLRTSRNIFFLLLGIFFIFVFGEEISWGQRIFGLTTPGPLEEINLQREINIHNLSIFRIISTNRIFTVFWFVYCVVLPVLHSTVRRLQRFFERINIPILPIFMSALFLINYGISRLVGSVVATDVQLQSGAVEIKECDFGLLFFAVMLWFLYSSQSEERYIK